MKKVLLVINEEDARALIAFWEYGATRGNHPDNLGADGSGPLTVHIPAMTRVARFAYEAIGHLAAAGNASPDVDLGSAL